MKKQKHTAYKFQVPRIRDAGEQHIDLPHCEHALQTTTDKVLDWKSLCFMHREGVAWDQRQLHEYRLALAFRQRFLSRLHVHVVEI